MTGIYLIRNMVNGKKYVGLSTNIPRRFMEHKCPRNMKKELSLARAMRKYGRENFRMEILEECSADQLEEREIYWIAALKPEYNRTAGGKGSVGHIVSEKARKRLADAARGQWQRLTPEQKAERVTNNLCGPKKPYHPSINARLKLHLANVGKKLSTQHCQKISKSLKGKPRPNLGHCKMVEAFSLTGERKGLFSSIAGAAEILGICPTNITQVIKGRQSHCRGLRWSLVVNPLKP